MTGIPARLGHTRRTARFPVLMALAAMAVALLPGHSSSAAQGPGFSPEFNADQPIEITANRLDVFQEQQTAIFKGRVDAVQGAMRLRAEELKVFYNAASGEVAGSSGQIRRLTASGGVQIWNADERAQGERATYDIPAKEIRMTGNVVLSKGGNTLRGSTLVIDMNTGRSKLLGGQSAGQETGGRVRGLFEAPK